MHRLTGIVNLNRADLSGGRWFREGIGRDEFFAGPEPRAKRREHRRPACDNTKRIKR